MSNALAFPTIAHIYPRVNQGGQIMIGNMMIIIKNQARRNRSMVLYIVLIVGFVTYFANNILTDRTQPNKNSYENNTNYVVSRTEPNSIPIVKAPKPHTIAESSLNNSSLTNLSENTRTLKLTPKLQTNLAHKMGHVNVHVWYKVCISHTDSLRQLPLFPLWPSVRGEPEMPNELVSIISDMWSSQRVMGLLYPRQSGDYKFEISSNTISEFWMSSSEDPAKATLLARNSKNYVLGIGTDMGKRFLKSKNVSLVKGQVYYFEILHGMNDLYTQQVQVRWMLPGAKNFTAIPKSSLSTVIKNDDSLNIETRRLVLSSASLRLQESIPKKPELHQWADSRYGKSFEAYSSYTRENLNVLKFGNGRKIMSAFKTCDYSPSYLVRRAVKRYEAEVLTHFSSVFPEDDTGNKIWYNYHSHLDRQGNTLIDESVVIQIINTFMNQLEDKFPGEYRLANVVNVECNADAKLGKRFFLELVLLENKTNELQRLSEYVYQFKNDSTLYKPKNFKWLPSVKINAILTAKNQGPWVVHYIKSMAQVLRATHDNHVHLIIVDYGNNGVDVEEELRRNGINSYTLIKKTGKFHKTMALQEATNTIKDNNSIVFLTDLHLDVPNNIFESVRKHTIQGIMAYTPIVFRLSHCGRPESEQTPTSGRWESYGFGVFSTYKSDWNSFGGVNVKEFGTKWGGEDSEMADRVLSKRYEIERLRLPYFYHYYHDKKGMWDQ